MNDLDYIDPLENEGTDDHYDVTDPQEPDLPEGDIDA